MLTSLGISPSLPLSLSSTLATIPTSPEPNLKRSAASGIGRQARCKFFPPLRLTPFFPPSPSFSLPLSLIPSFIPSLIPSLTHLRVLGCCKALDRSLYHPLSPEALIEADFLPTCPPSHPLSFSRFIVRTLHLTTALGLRSKFLYSLHQPTLPSVPTLPRTRTLYIPSILPSLSASLPCLEIRPYLPAYLPTYLGSILPTSSTSNNKAHTSGIIR